MVFVQLGNWNGLDKLCLFCLSSGSHFSVLDSVSSSILSALSLFDSKSDPSLLSVATENKGYLAEKHNLKWHWPWLYRKVGLDGLVGGLLRLDS